MLGTFARVCLVKPIDAPTDDRDSVYALKILRKTEGKLIQAVRELFEMTKFMFERAQSFV